MVQCETMDSKWTLAALSMAKPRWAKTLVLISEGGSDANAAECKQRSGNMIRERLAWNDNQS